MCVCVFMCVCVYLCVCVCVCVETNRQTDRQTDRQDAGCDVQDVTCFFLCVKERGRNNLI
jgi:hypothetical protein